MQHLSFSTPAPQVLKAYVLEAVDPELVKRVKLFGSRALDSHRQDSDFDILVELTRDVSARTKHNLRRTLQRHLIHRLQAPVDVLLLTATEAQEAPNALGSAVKDAYELGKVL